MRRLQPAERAAVLVEDPKNTFFPIMRRVLRPGNPCMSMPRSKGFSSCCQTGNVDG